ncbi:MAG: methionyl-tRNA formyltransferase, partial [Lachnospiraceae bacterium]|nr:methionyl-tRNA formyltransferase [Lachnospiraceae bacterium]
WKEEVVTDRQLQQMGTEVLSESVEPGTVMAVTKDAFYVQTGDGILKISAVQPEGKKRMEVKDFLLGYPVKVGEKLGEN